MDKEEAEDDIIVMDLPPGFKPKKASRPKGQVAQVAEIDPNDVGEDGQIKLYLSSKPKSRNKMTEAIASATLFQQQAVGARGRQQQRSAWRDPWPGDFPKGQGNSWRCHQARGDLRSAEGMDQLLGHQHTRTQGPRQKNVSQQNQLEGSAPGL